MKLSEAIMMNGMCKPQGFGGQSMYSQVAPCALGGAAQMVGIEQDYFTVDNHWPWLMKLSVNCPACVGFFYPQGHGSLVITHLNDVHRWTRAQIAEWVATVEPAEPMHIGTTISELMDQVTKTVEQCICKGCGKFDDKCECTIPYGDEYRASLEDDPARQR